MNAQVALRHNQILERAQGLDGLLDQEYTKGEVAGIGTAFNLPELLIEDFTVEIKEKQKELRDG